MKLRKNTLFPIRLENFDALVSEYGIERKQIDTVLETMRGVRESILKSVAEDAQSSRYAMLGFPESTLLDYAKNRSRSELGRVFRTANRLHELVDRVVVLGCGSAATGAKAILDSCCQPYWNELSRADRGSKPRIYFEGDSFDNDSLQALLHLLETHKQGLPSHETNRWALVVVHPCGSARLSEVDVAYLHLRNALEKSVVSSSEAISSLIVQISRDGTAVTEKLLPLGDCFTIPPSLPESGSLFSPVGLVPAAVLGVNLMEILAGATHMSQHFVSAPPKENLVFQLAAFQHLVRLHNAENPIVVQLWSKALLSFGKWFEEFSTEFGNDFPATAGSFVTRSQLHSSEQPRSKRQFPTAIINIVSDRWRFDALNIDLDARTPQTFRQAIQERLKSRVAGASAGSELNLVLPIIDELHMGQLFQLFMLAAMLESHLPASNGHDE